MNTITRSVTYKILVQTPLKRYESAYIETTDDKFENIQLILREPKYLTFKDMDGYQLFFTKEMLGRSVIMLKVK